MQNYCSTLSHQHHNIQIFCIIYIGNIYFADGFSKCCTILECYLIISFICISCCWVCFCSSDCYGSIHKYVCIVAVTETWFDLPIVVFDLIWVFVLHILRIFTSNQLFVLNFDGWLLVLSTSFMCFRYSILAIYL